MNYKKKYLKYKLKYLNLKKKMKGGNFLDTISNVAGQFKNTCSQVCDLDQTLKENCYNVCYATLDKIVDSKTAGELAELAAEAAVDTAKTYMGDTINKAGITSGVPMKQLYDFYKSMGSGSLDEKVKYGAEQFKEITTKEGIKDIFKMFNNGLTPEQIEGFSDTASEMM